MNFKIKCETAGLAVLAQKIAVSKGAKWLSGDRRVLYREPMFLYCVKGTMTRDTIDDFEYFRTHALPEVNMSELNRL